MPITGKFTKLTLTTFQPCLILMQSSDFAGQGHLTPFSTGQLMTYKIKF